MSAELEDLATSLFNNSVPTIWAKKAFPSLKPLGAWIEDLVERCVFIKRWIDRGAPSVFWISGMFFPQGFLTGTLQNFARRTRTAIDRISFGFRIMAQVDASKVERGPADGCYISGLFLEGARFDVKAMVLRESEPKVLYTKMNIIWLLPQVDRAEPSTGVYKCPVYKTLTRSGTLSTTGHSTNFVMPIELPSDKTQRHWIKRGVALICALDY